MTGQENDRQQYQHEYPYQENEIRLIDYLRVIWKWKWLIVGGTLFCGLLAGVISLNMPKLYRVTLAVEPGVSDIDENGNLIYFSIKSLNGKIDSGLLNKRIEKELNRKISKTNFKFRTNIDRDANILIISSDWHKKDADFGLEAARKLIALLSEDNDEIVRGKKKEYERQILIKRNAIGDIETHRKDLDKQIKIKLNNIDKKKTQIKFRQATLTMIKKRIQELVKETKNAKDNTAILLKQRNAILNDKNANEMTLLLYATTIQQNAATSNILSNQIYDLRTMANSKEAEIEKLKQNIKDIETSIERMQLTKTEGLQRKINDIKAQINSLTLKKNLISNIKVLQNPEVSEGFVRPKKIQIILLSGVISCFFLIFLAFFFEYIRNATRMYSKD